MKEEIQQYEQDAISLDYTKWSDKRQRTKLPTDHDLWQQERDRVLARMKADNAEAGRKRRATLEAERTEKRREFDAELDREFEPQRQTLMRSWLVDHPGKTENDFMRDAWRYLRANLVEERQKALLDAEMRTAAESGRYRL